VKRTILTPAQTAWLSATIDRNRLIFGDARMMAEDADADDGVGGGDDDKSDADKDADKGKGVDKSGDEPLGEPGKKALDAERDARKAAEQQVTALKGEFDGFKTALTTALGIKGKEGDGAEDALTAVQKELASIRHEAAVLRLANEHKITDAKDLEILKTATDEDSMKKLAERLAPSEENQRDAKSRTRPKPDRGQGGSSSDGKKGALVGLSGSDLYDRLHPPKQTAS
jgi:hypothetical protein